MGGDDWLGSLCAPSTFDSVHLRNYLLTRNGGNSSQIKFGILDRPMIERIAVSSFLDHEDELAIEMMDNVKKYGPALVGKFQLIPRPFPKGSLLR